MGGGGGMSVSHSFSGGHQLRVMSIRLGASSRGLEVVEEAHGMLDCVGICQWQHRVQTRVLGFLQSLKGISWAAAGSSMSHSSPSFSSGGGGASPSAIVLELVARTLLLLHVDLQPPTARILPWAQALRLVRVDGVEHVQLHVAWQVALGLGGCSGAMAARRAATGTSRRCRRPAARPASPCTRRRSCPATRDAAA